MNNDFKEQQQKADWEISFLQTEHEQATLRNRDANFLSKEIKKLEKDKEARIHEIQKKALLANQEQAELKKKAALLKKEAEADLDKAEKQLAGVEAVVQQYEENHAAPAWMVHAQLKESQTKSMTAQEEASWRERNAKRRALWQ